MTRVVERWGQGPTDFTKTFFGFPPLQDYLLACVSGDPDAKATPDWAERWTLENVLRGRVPVDHCLSLCCGFGEVERRLARLGAFRHCLGLDVSSAAVNAATEAARAEGMHQLSYRVADLNEVDLGVEEYDLVWANGALHHIAKLENLAAAVHRALKPGGVLVANEYVGPNRRNIPLRQREIINAAIHLIPPRLRTIDEGSYVPPFFRQTKWLRLLYKLYRMVSLQPYVRRQVGPGAKHFYFGKVWDEPSALARRIDPSECVRSHDIIPVLQGSFARVDIRYYNGSVLFYALERHFYEHYDDRNPHDRSLLETLITVEQHAIRAGEISPDHAHILAYR